MGIYVSVDFSSADDADCADFIFSSQKVFSCTFVRPAPSVHSNPRHLRHLRMKDYPDKLSFMSFYRLRFNSSRTILPHVFRSSSFQLPSEEAEG